MTHLSNIEVYHYLVLGLILFFIGLLGIIISKKLIKILLSIEIMINAVCINFVAISNYYDGFMLEGNTMTVFIIIFSLIQTLIFTAIAINMYKHKNVNTTDKLEELKG